MKKIGIVLLILISLTGTLLGCGASLDGAGAGEDGGRLWNGQSTRA